MVTRHQRTQTILAVDDDADARGTIGRALKREGHIVVEATDAQSALRLAREYRPDLIVLDIGLPDMSGFDLCGRLRTLPFITDVPILFLSCYQGANHVAQALEAGGDDYMRKPFAAQEFSARVRALLRRSPARQDTRHPTLLLNSVNYSVRVNERQIELTPTEFGLLDFLCSDPADYHSANQLLEKLWQYPAGGGDTALVRNHIRNLRRKIEIDPDHPSIIISLHGRGYTVQADVVETPQVS